MSRVLVTAGRSASAVGRLLTDARVREALDEAFARPGGVAEQAALERAPRDAVERLLVDGHVRAALDEAFARSKRPRGRPRVDGTYQLRLGFAEPTSVEEEWWQGQ